MKKFDLRKMLPTVLLFFWFFSLISSQYASGIRESEGDRKRPLVNQNALKELIKRILPKDAQRFVIEIIAESGGKDVFEVESRNGSIILRGNNGISVAGALNYYLKSVAHCDINWSGTNLNMPHPLPAVPQKIRRVSPYRYRYYFNYCTFNYTASWWDWDRWQREIDFMALNGINLPLALTGQNAVWKRVYKSMGFTDKDLERFFSGPAYFSWFWMGNLDGYGGPLPESWMKSHEALQKKILKRERELGMTPVLPAFSGHVPPSFKEKYPETKLIRTNWGAGFNDVYSIDPTDTMFTFIGKKFITGQTKTYGTDHYYSSDTFNENKPPSGDSTFLHGVAKKVYQSMSQVDPLAVWVMQGWLFFSDSRFWKPARIRAMLNAVPDDKMIILDLWSEVNPVWNKTDAYYGKTWIWCMLHNFGGRSGMYGDLEHIANNPISTLCDSKSGKMKGIGITAEGIEQNPALYELMLDNTWRNETIDTDEWIKDYTVRRYGMRNQKAEMGWDKLIKTLYNANASIGSESIITARPTFNPDSIPMFAGLSLPYPSKELLPAWEDFIIAGSELQNSEGFKYDVVDVTRQVLANYGNLLYLQMTDAYKKKNISDFKNYCVRFINLIVDIDRLLLTKKEFLLGRWLADAKKWATNENEKQLYEKNARDLITLWGDKNSGLHDYARKQWNGLLNGFYKPRWEMFMRYALNCLENNRTLYQKSIDGEMKYWEWKWVNDNQFYPDLPEGDPVTVSKEIFSKYYAMVKEAFENLK
jgi:alpha-N-acetylglucosaminidase